MSPSPQPESPSPSNPNFPPRSPRAPAFRSLLLEPSPPGPSWRRSLRTRRPVRAPSAERGVSWSPRRAGGRPDVVPLCGQVARSPSSRWVPSSCVDRDSLSPALRSLPAPLLCLASGSGIFGISPWLPRGVRARRLYSESVAACLWGTPRHVTCARTLVTPHGHVHVSLPARVASHFSTRHKRRAAALRFLFFFGLKQSMSLKRKRAISTDAHGYRSQRSPSCGSVFPPRVTFCLPEGFPVPLPRGGGRGGARGGAISPLPLTRSLGLASASGREGARRGLGDSGTRSRRPGTRSSA